MSGDGLVGQLGGALAESARRSASCPAAAATTSRGRSGSRRDPAGAVDAAGGRDERAIDVGEANGAPFLVIASLGFDSEANRIANEAQRAQGQPRLRLRRPARAGRLEAGALHGRRDDGERFEVRYTVAAANSKAYGGGMFIAPGRRARRRHARRRHAGSEQAALPRHLPEGLQGDARRRGRGRRACAPPRSRSAPTGPSPSTRTASTSPTCRPGPACSARALGVIAPPAGHRGMSALFGPSSRSRARRRRPRAGRSGRGGGTTLPGRLLLRMAPDAIARLAAQLDGGSIDRQRHQRQDDDGRDDRRRSCARPGASRSTTAPARTCTWGVATALLEQSGERGPVRGRRGLAAAGRAAARPRLIVLGNLFRDQLDRYGELEHLADEWAALVDARAGQHRVRAQRRRPADRRPRPRPRAGRRRPGVTYFGIEDPRRRSPSSSTPTTPSTAAAAALPTPTSAPSSATSATTAARTATPTARRPTSPPPRIELLGMAGSRVDGRDARGRARAPAPPPRPLQRLQRAGGASPPRSARASRSSWSAGGSSRCAAVFGRVETIEVGGKPVSILLIKNPAGANEVLRTLRARELGGRPARPLDRAQRPDRRRPRRLLDLGRRLRAARRRRAPSRLRGHPRARDGAAPQVRGLAAGRRSRSRSRSTARSTPLSPPRPTACSRCRPTRRCSSCGRCSPTAGSQGVLGMTEARAEQASGRTSSAAPTPPTCRSGRSSRPPPAARCSSSAAARAGSPCTSPTRAIAVIAVERDPELVEALAAPGRRPADDRRAGRPGRPRRRMDAGCPARARSSRSRRLHSSSSSTPERARRCSRRLQRLSPRARARGRPRRRGPLLADGVEGRPRSPRCATSAAGSTRASRSGCRSTSGRSTVAPAARARLARRRDRASDPRRRRCTASRRPARGRGRRGGPRARRAARDRIRPVEADSVVVSPRLAHERRGPRSSCACWRSTPSR